MEATMDTSRSSPTIGAPVQAAEPTGRGSTRGYGIVAAVCVLILLIAAAVILVVGRQPASFAAGSPEAELQAYLSAYGTGDLEGAYSYFSKDVQRSMSFAQFRMSAGEYRWQDDEDRRMLLDTSRTIAPDRVALDITIEYRSTSIFGTSRWTQPLTVRMVREDGSWRLDDPLIGTEPAPYWPVDASP
jgi:hypothetical protein